ncbi:MAG: hypothetical protein ABGX16_09035 [Pirellulales bacterium]
MSIKHLSRLPLHWPGKLRNKDCPKQIAYYLNVFPDWSEAFIQRELVALKKSRIPVMIVAQTTRECQFFDIQARRLMKETFYLEDVNKKQLQFYVYRTIRRKPFTLLCMFIYVLLCRPDARKSATGDRKVFVKALHLAGVLEDHRIDHIHSPWANHDAFVVLVAAGILKVPYSVQARAYEIYQEKASVGLVEKLRHAAFVITNSRSALSDL